MPYVSDARSEIRSRNEATEWDIRQTDDTIAINTQVQGRTEALKCETNGKNCQTKEDGEDAEVSFYFNGPMLIEMDLLGHNKDHVVKKRLKLGQDGKTLEVEVMHINPQGPTEKWVFAKQ